MVRLGALAAKYLDIQPTTVSIGQSTRRLQQADLTLGQMCQWMVCKFLFSVVEAIGYTHQTVIGTGLPPRSTRPGSVQLHRHYAAQF